MSAAKRLARRAWPVSDGCFAFDSSSRVRKAGRKSAAAPAPSPTKSAVSCILIPLFTTAALQSHDGARRPAGRPQLPPDQPDPPSGADAVHGLVQQDRAAAGARPLDRRLAAVCRPAPGGGEEAALLQPARLLHPRAQARSAAE